MSNKQNTSLVAQHQHQSLENIAGLNSAASSHEQRRKSTLTIQRRNKNNHRQLSSPPNSKNNLSSEMQTAKLANPPSQRNNKNQSNHNGNSHNRHSKKHHGGSHKKRFRNHNQRHNNQEPSPFKSVIIDYSSKLKKEIQEYLNTSSINNNNNDSDAADNVMKRLSRISQVSMTMKDDNNDMRTKKVKIKEIHNFATLLQQSSANFLICLMNQWKQKQQQQKQHHHHSKNNGSGVEIGTLLGEILYLYIYCLGLVKDSLDSWDDKEEEDCHHGGQRNNNEYDDGRTISARHTKGTIQHLCMNVWNNANQMVLTSLRINSTHDNNNNNYSSTNIGVGSAGTDKKMYSLMKLTTNQIQDCTSVLLEYIKYYLSCTKTNATSSKEEEQKVLCSRNVHTLCLCLLNFIKGFARDLDADRSVRPIIRFVICPILEIVEIQPPVPPSKITTTYPDTPSLMHSTKITAMYCIISLLSWKQHASTILAPVIMKVGIGIGGSSGVSRSNEEEKYYCSSLKNRILRCMEVQLSFALAKNNSEDSTDSTSIWDTYSQCCISHCLYSILDQIHVINKNHLGQKKREEKEDYKLDAAKILNWIYKSMQNDEPTNTKQKDLSDGEGGEKDDKPFRWYFLRLLCSCIRIYPQTCAQKWSMFLPQTQNIGIGQSSSKILSKSLESHQSQQRITLLSIMSSKESDINGITLDEKLVAIIALRELLNVLPLRRWTSTSKRAALLSRSEYLSGRVATSLLQVINCTLKEVQICELRETLTELSLLTKVIITVIPFDVYDGVVQSAMLLLDSLSVHCQTVGNSVANILADCMGGIETPQGNITSLPAPTKLWLSGSQSDKFIYNLFQFMTKVDEQTMTHRKSQDIEYINLFIRIIQTVTWVAIESVERKDMFFSIIQNLSRQNDKSVRLFGARIVQAYFEGKTLDSQRGNFGHMANLSSSTILILPYLSPFLKDEDVNIRKCALLSFGSLDASDWDVLLQHDSNPFAHILSLCLEYSGDPDNNVRSEACKSIGNIITVCMAAKQEENYNFQMKEKVAEMIEGSIKVTGSAIEDSSSGVRSMALFAIGNIAVAVVNNGSRDEDVLRKIPLIQFCDATFERLYDANEKVVGNAIRTIGHLFHLLYNFHDIIRIRAHDADKWIELCGLVASALAGRIQEALSDEADLTIQRSWKLRSHAKRHAWGSCQALSPLLTCSAARSKINIEGVSAALHQLIRCVELAHIINEKIAVGAISTIQATPQETWLSCGSELVGFCLATCLNRSMAVKKFPLAAFNNDINSTLNKMLQWAGEESLGMFLANEDISSNAINYVYDLMVDQRFESKCFAHFSSALRESVFKDDISLIQKFHSRAMLERRREQEINQIQSLLQSFEASDDEDEL